MNKKIEDSLSKLEAAVARLGEALGEDSSNPLYLDATVQRFEFVFELAWKTLKRALEAEGLDCKTPRETFKAAYQASWINEEALWVQMLDDRNVTSHTYDEPLAAEIYDNIKSYYPELVKLAALLRAKHPRSE
ncbi:HI0074 family nucleotidyltransferase substrate-binding subunit [bacterium]|nr:HI0074 family nucleotidyltransferase substrate-binding subunit [bacterium]